MDPVTGMMIVSAIGGLAQAYNAEKAAGASKARLKALEAEFNKMVPPDYDVSITDPPEYITSKIPPTAFSAEKLSPAQYQIAVKYKPEIAPLIAEKNPELIKQSQASQEGRQAQVDALRKMRSIASIDQDPELAQRLSEASRKAQTDAQSRGQSIISDMQRRGAGNSGLAMMAQQQAGADAMDREASMGQSAAAEAYKNKLQAIRESAAMGGNISQAEDSLAGKNADILNEYNQRFTKQNQDFQAQRAAAMNQAGMFNAKNAQDVSNSNIDATNKYALANQSRNDMMANTLRGQAVDERNYQNAIADKRANWAQGQKEYGNTLQNNAFNNKMSIAQGRQGLASMGMNIDNQAAQSRNAMIQGGMQAGTGYYSQQADNDRWNKSQDRADARAGLGLDDEEEPDDEETSQAGRRKMPQYASSGGAAYGPKTWKSGV